MANRKKSTKDSGILDEDIRGILLITVGVLMLISVFSPADSGILGIISKKVLLFIFGLGAFVFPFIICFVGICSILKKGKVNFNRKFYGIVLFLITTLFCIQMADIVSNGQNQGVLDGITEIYNSDSILHGGVICYLIDVPLYKLFGKLGAFVIFIAMYIVSFILINKVSLYGIIQGIKSKLIDIKRESINNRFEDETVLDIEDNLNTKIQERAERKQNKIKIIDFIKKATLDDEKDDTFEDKEDKVDKVEEKTLPTEPIVAKSFTENKNNKVKNINEDDSYIDKELKNEINQNIFNNCKDYKFPLVEFLNENPLPHMKNEDKKGLIDNANKLDDTLSSFGVKAKVIQVTRGPSVTRFELQPNAGVKVSKIVNLADDIALNLAASGVRIEAPIPGKSAVGIEVPNKELTSVTLREILESDQFIGFNKNLAFALGKDIAGNCVVWDLAKMPHLLIAGATGSGKSVCINTLIISLLYKYSPDDVRLLMIDPKVVELNIYNGIPHLLIPVVTEPKKAAGALNWAVNEMTRRYKLFADNNVRNVESYNELYSKGRVEEKLPLIVIIIDELADLMMVCPHDIEDYIGRLAQMARAAGMHLVIATQRPSVDVITGVIKANIPSRISFAVSSQIDSRTILDMSGAEKLLGRGDMLFYPTGEPKPIRIQGAFISEEEVEKIVTFIKEQECDVDYEHSIIEEINTSVEVSDEDGDELLDEAIRTVTEMNQASTSLLQRRLRIGYNRAARIMEQLEERGIISAKDGSKPRQVLINKDDIKQGGQ